MFGNPCYKTLFQLLKSLQTSQHCSHHFNIFPLLSFLLDPDIGILLLPHIRLASSTIPR